MKKQRRPLWEPISLKGHAFTRPNGDLALPVTDGRVAPNEPELEPEVRVVRENDYQRLLRLAKQAQRAG